MSVESTSQTVPTVMATKLAYRRGKREGVEEPVSKRQIPSGDGRWAGRCGMGRLNPLCETKIKGKNGDRERKIREKSQIRGNSCANGGGESEQSGVSCDSAKG